MNRIHDSNPGVHAAWTWSFARSGYRRRMKILVGGSVQHRAREVESRAMRGAVPRFLGIIPRNNAAEVWTHGAALVKRSLLVAIHGDFHRTVTHDGAGFQGNELVFLQIPRGQPIDVLRGRVNRFSSEVSSCSQGHPRWTV